MIQYMVNLAGGADVNLVVHAPGTRPGQCTEADHNFGRCNLCVDLQFSQHER